MSDAPEKQIEHQQTQHLRSLPDFGEMESLTGGRWLRLMSNSNVGHQPSEAR
ncbi:MAG: hypothetical protein HC941_05625 [Microcoleus sp. SU_5_3]|nr:hypothetical protein [Microcoleus sp. SU_5_3]